MANTTKSAKTTKPTEVETDVKNLENKIETTNVDNNENAILKKTIAEMTKQMQEMQAMMISMQSKQPVTITNVNNKTSIGCRFLNGITVYSPNREIEIFIPCGENNTIDFTDNEMNLLLKQKFFKDFLTEDVLYFVNEEDYTRHNLKKINSMDDNSIVEILNSRDNLKTIFDNYTNSKRNSPVLHCLFYTIVNLVDKGKINTLPVGVQREIEDYFNFKIDDARERIMFLNMVKST